jgi:hypothetical protein
LAEISDELKVQTFEFYLKAASPDPAYACQDIGKLVSHLQTIMDKDHLNIHDYDIILKVAAKNATSSWFVYSEEKNSGRAVLIKNMVLNRLDPLIKDPRFCKFKINQFVGSGGDTSVR